MPKFPQRLTTRFSVTREGGLKPKTIGTNFKNFESDSISWRNFEADVRQNGKKAEKIESQKNRHLPLHTRWHQKTTNSARKTRKNVWNWKYCKIEGRKWWFACQHRKKWYFWKIVHFWNRKFEKTLPWRIGKKPLKPAIVSWKSNLIFLK